MVLGNSKLQLIPRNPTPPSSLVVQQRMLSLANRNFSRTSHNATFDSDNVVTSNQTVTSHGPQRKGSVNTTLSSNLAISHDQYLEMDRAGGCGTLTEWEWEFWNVMNEYRRNNSRTMIPMGWAPRVVGFLHSENTERMTSGYPSDCCIHSWLGPSSQACPDITYKTCCYDCDDNGETADCMWSKPAEIFQNSEFATSYEIGLGGIETTSPIEALQAFENSPPHNAVILNIDGWEGMVWQEVGVSARGDYLFVQFFDQMDTYQFCQPPPNSSVHQYMATLMSEFGYNIPSAATRTFGFDPIILTSLIIAICAFFILRT